MRILKKDITVIWDSRHLKKYLMVDEIIEIIFESKNPQKKWKKLIESTKNKYDFDINTLIYKINDTKHGEICELEDWFKILNYLPDFNESDFIYLLHDIRKDKPKNHFYE